MITAVQQELELAERHDLGQRFGGVQVLQLVEDALAGHLRVLGPGQDGGLAHSGLQQLGAERVLY